MDVAKTSLMARILTELRERRTITCKVDMPKEMAIRFDATVGQMVELIQLGPALGLLIIKRGQSGKQVMIRGSFGWSELDTDADRRKAVLKVLRQTGGRFYSGYQEGSMLDCLAIWLGILPDGREHSEDLVVLRAAIDELSIRSALMRHIVEGQLVGIYLLEKGPLEIKPLRAAGRSTNSERDLFRTKLAERVDGRLDLEGKPISMTVAHWLSISDHRAKQLLREFVEQEVDVEYTCNSQGDIVELWLDGTNSGAPRGPGIDEEAAVANTPAEQAAADVPAYSPLVRRIVYFLGSMGGRLEDGERTVNLQVREGLGLDQANASSSVWVAEKAGAIVKKMINPRKTRSIELSKQARAWLAANPDPSFIALPIPSVASMVVGGSDTLEEPAAEEPAAEEPAAEEPAAEEPAAEEPAADAALHLLAARPAELPVPTGFGRGDADLDDLIFLGAERLLRIIELERAAARLFAEARELGARIQAMSQESTRMRDEAAKLRAEELNPDLVATILDRAEEVRRRLGIA